ncbi:restriction endonuclease subunit S [Prevotella brevis]|uniref:Restriction endonuclease subunit S n=1 Tax=Xylanibacter brevis TaxID=83231 RepID=A0ABS9CIZ8_9BACT|nr:restriction endonuclease subunit S [Xylanibacter brevis]MCF2564535.1 restriction endonuclease subunit S [Xylanibacter brevis]
MNTKALRQKILDLAIHGKLVPQDPNDEPASVLLERIRAEKERLIKEGKIKKPKKSKAACDKPHYPFELPKGWEWTTVGEISKSILYGVSESAKSKGEYKLLRITDIKNSAVDWNTVPYTDYDEHKANAYLISDGDILFARTGATVGKSYLVKGLQDKAIYASYLIRVQTFNEILPEYVKYFFESGFYWEQIQRDSVGIGQPNVNGTTLSLLALSIPPINEQHRIVNELGSWLNIIDAIDNGKAELQIAIKRVKSKILDLAIHGKLVPQYPNDEPASELLKRINPKTVITCDNHQYGKLPKGWCETHIGDAFKVTMGQSPDGSSLNPIDGMEFHQGKILFGNKYLRKSSVLTNSPTKIADADTLLLCVRAPVGVVNITKQRICIGRGLCCLTPTKAINLDYAFYMLTTFQEKFESQSTGSTFKAISGSIIKNEQLWLPPLSEQHRIVAKIEELFAQLDKIEASL